MCCNTNLHWDIRSIIKVGLISSVRIESFHWCYLGSTILHLVVVVNFSLVIIKLMLSWGFQFRYSMMYSEGVDIVSLWLKEIVYFFCIEICYGDTLIVICIFILFEFTFLHLMNWISTLLVSILLISLLLFFFVII